MRIFYAFLILLISAFLFMLPVVEAIYDYRTMQRIETERVPTAVGVTTGNVILGVPPFENDTDVLNIISDSGTDAPAFSTYNTTNRMVIFSGLTANGTRIITITYLIDALSTVPAVTTLMGWLPFIWYLVCVAFIPAALFAIFTHRAWSN